MIADALTKVVMISGMGAEDLLASYGASALLVSVDAALDQLDPPHDGICTLPDASDPHLVEQTGVLTGALVKRDCIRTCRTP
jgi:hypothetical protein